jgi:hypothetical protein
MTYLNALESELKRAGIPPRRRIRILTEFADHLQENPEAELGAPRELARQFADELGTRLARTTAYRAFGVLAVAATVLAVMFVEGGRTWGGWVGYGSHPTSGYMPSWWVPLMGVWFISAQVALAAGSLALLRAWRLRHQAVISAADAAVLNRRVAVGLAAGTATMLVLPATDLMLARPLSYHLPDGQTSHITDQWHSLFAVTPSSWWSYVAIIGGPVLIAAMLFTIPSVLIAARLKPNQQGVAGDLTLDLGVQETLITPALIALSLSAILVVVMLVIGIRSSDPLAGLARGLVDAGLCMVGFVTLGAFLGLRSTPAEPQSDGTTLPVRQAH